jgi:CHASE2 domain-containing sensor protein
LDRQKNKRALAAVLMSALALSGCAASIADMPLAGTPADAPPRSKEAGSYLPVNDLPPDRDEAALAPAQRAKIQAELIAARDRQASATAGKDSTGK